MSQKVGTTHTSDSNDFSITVVRGFYETLLRGDLDGILDLLDPQVEWRAPESLPWGGVFHGHEGFREFFGKLFGQPVDSRREIRQYLSAGDRVVVLLRLFGRRKGHEVEIELPEVHIWTVRNGKILGLEAYFDTAMFLGALEIRRGLKAGITSAGFVG
jgi:ketosteroid isomerase-like protein